MSKQRRDVRRDPDAIMYNCFLCNRAIQMGPHVYEGRYIGTWDIYVCDIDYNANWDGLVPGTHPRLMEHLRNNGIEPKLNASGWIDWPV